ncbi:MAG: DEAD/DEAH box helicase family protein [Candidatus Poribacteria bacterium]|nr:DEAD/DEAH box helicase family protein [Candidatus Poribacteria bacterium]
MNRRIQLPAVIVIYEKQRKNIIQQMIQPETQLEVSIENYKKNRIEGHILRPINSRKEQILLIYNKTKSVDGFNKILQIKQDDLLGNSNDFIDLSERKWIKHPKIPKRTINYKNRVQKVLDSWQDTFSYKSEDRDKDIKGLRPPQIGAVHAAHTHWTVSNEAGTIVMPTGTGKTETMLSILVSKQCEKLLVVVPTDVLRTQIANKFLTLGILKDFNIVSTRGLYPIVGILQHRPKNCDDVDYFFEKCNVIVTTMQITGQCGIDVQERMANHCPYLFIDEAHHISAKTWKEFKQKFSERRILQFTATPFRNDKQPVDGDIIYNYPLKIAQEEGYFKPIHFTPVREYTKVDEAIANMAVKQLREDLKKYDHIIMARVGRIEKAKEVLSIYAKFAEFNPVLIHSGIKLTKRNEIRERIINKESRIVVCVDMFGEGFDLPEMKIAALHDIRKSLAVTLQLAGRFTRTGEKLGNATFIANITDVKVKDKLEKLYYNNSDWNVLLRDASEEIIQEKIDLHEFINGFQDSLSDITLKRIRPAMSTVIYKTTCKNWKPENYKKGIYGSESYERIEHAINNQKRTLVIVTGKKIPVDWAQSIDIYNWHWELYILFWDKSQNLLFIHTSDKNGYYEKLAKAICDEVELIKGGPVFRCFAGINHLKLQNVGLIELLGRLIRYTMRAGVDIEPGLTQIQRQRASKSNIFGFGFENGYRTSIGCSYKGRIWSRKKTNLNSLRKWCSNIGQKVLDDTIDPDEVLKGTLVPRIISQKPDKMPIGIEWPEKIIKEDETTFSFLVDNKELHLYQTDIIIIDPSVNGDIKFALLSENAKIELQLIVSKNNFKFAVIGNKKVMVRKNAYSVDIIEFFYNDPPKIWFVDGSLLEGNIYTELNKEYDPYLQEDIQTWNWKGIKIKKESQGKIKQNDSIQYKAIEELKKKKYDIIFDDDGPGEAADIICVRDCKKSINVEFYHCKFSLEETPGARIADFYTVCGQAQKSINWKEKPTELFDHLLRRDAIWNEENGISRIEVGTPEELLKFKEMTREVPIELSIFIIQPGLSRSKATNDILRLLSVTDNYLRGTYQLDFGVIASN